MDEIIIFCAGCQMGCLVGMVVMALLQMGGERRQRMQAEHDEAKARIRAAWPPPPGM